MFKKSKKLLGVVLLTLAALFITTVLPGTNGILPGGIGSFTVSASTYQAWDSAKAYVAGDLVSYNGADYKAKWWTQGETPGVASVWELVSTNGGSYETWNAGKAYTGGSFVTYNGAVYKAKWWTQGDTPGTASVWELVSGTPETPGIADGTYRVSSKVSGKLLDIADKSTADGAKLQQWTDSSVTNQQFKVEKQADGYYKITAVHSGKVLDVPNSSATSGLQLQQWTDNGTDAQRWQIKSTGDGYYKVTSKASGLVMDVKGSSTADGAAIQQYTDNGTDAQKWSFLTGTTDPGGPGDPVTGFKVVGYYPSWQPDKINTIQYNNLTHINYAFAIPTSEGALLPLENSAAAVQIINQAHQKGVKVLLAIGGWSYNGTPLETTFMSATSTPEKIKKFGDAIVSMAKQYGFDGVDMDWEHPRADGTSKNQYEALMVYLRSELNKSNMLLTAAVLSGVTPEGVIYWDSAGQTDKVISVVDWFNVMAYDGGDGNRHSTYEFAVKSAEYWKNTRHMPAEKVVLGVPFYGRPSWATYAEILAANPQAYNTDISMINGMEAYYNGIPTIKKKTQWACDNVGGIMIWELSQDTTDKSKSLLNAIGDTVRANFSD
jgi:GH18 family chitinase/chitodextrinase